MLSIFALLVNEPSVAIELKGLGKARDRAAVIKKLEVKGRVRMRLYVCVANRCMRSRGA